MNPSLSNGTKAVRFGNVFVRLCMVISIVLSNMMFDVSSVQASTSRGGEEEIAVPVISEKVVEAPAAADGDAGFTMVLYDNMNFTPPAYSTTSGTAINYDWEYGSPEGLPDDKFSIRWYGKFLNNEITEAEEFTFIMNNDDGVTFWINGEKIAENGWSNDGTVTYTFEPGVAYDFVYEYYEDGGGAHAQLEMESASVSRRIVSDADFLEVDLSDVQTQFLDSKAGALADAVDYVTETIILLDGNNDPISDDVYVSVIGERVQIDGSEVAEGAWVQIAESGTAGNYVFNLSSRDLGDKEIRVRLGNFSLDEIHFYEFLLGDENSGLRGEYYSNKTLTEPSYAVRDNEAIDFNWENGTPMDGMPADSYSVRWTGYVTPDYSEVYTFYTYSDDGMRLWINGNLVVDGWVIQGPTYYSGSISLTAGEAYDIVVEYFEEGGGAVAGLEWESASQVREVISRDNLSMPEEDDSTFSVDFSSTEIVGNGTDATQITVTLQDEEGNPIYDEEVYIRVSGTGNVFNGAEIGESEWAALLPVGQTGQYIGDLVSTTAEDKTIRFMVGTQVEESEYSLTVTEPGSSCVETTAINGDGEEETYLTVSSGLVCELEGNSILYNSITVDGELVISPSEAGQVINVYADDIEVASEAQIRVIDANSETIYHAKTINVDGIISANGADGQIGGTLHIIADQLSGIGILQANGGTGYTFGAGGDVILDISTDQFEGSVEAYGGERSGGRGNPGLINYVQQGVFIIDNDGSYGSYTFEEDDYSFTRIELGNWINAFFMGEETEINISDGIYRYSNESTIYTPELSIEGTIPNFESVTIDGVLLNYDIGDIGAECVIEYDGDSGESELYIEIGDTCWLAAGTYSIDSIDIMGMLYLLTDTEDQVFNFDGTYFTTYKGTKIRPTENSAIINITAENIWPDGIIESGSQIGGDGGEINIVSTDYFAGFSKIKANGGVGNTLGDGGKITINATGSDYFTGEIQAYSGISGTEVGTPGTIEYIHEGRLIIDNAGLGGTIVFPVGEYSYDRIDLGNGIEAIFAGEETMLFVNSGLYGTGDTTPILTLEGSLLDSEEMVIENVIFNWSGYIDFNSNVEVQNGTFFADGEDSIEVALTLSDLEGAPITSESVYIRVSGEENIINGSSVSVDEWVHLYEVEMTSGLYVAQIASTQAGSKDVEFKVGYAIISDGYSVEFIPANEGIGLYAQYYDNISFEGAPCDEVYGDYIDFSLGTGEWPISDTCTTVEAVRWIGKLTSDTTDSYTIYTSNNDADFWINGYKNESGADSLTVDLIADEENTFVLELSNISMLFPGMIELSWKFGSSFRVHIPIENLTYLDLGQSSVISSKATILADGEETTEINVQAIRSDGLALDGYPVYVQIDGDSIVNGIAVSAEEWAELGVTDSEGNVSGTIATTSAGTRNVLVTVDGMLFGDVVSFEAVEPEVYGFQILFDGESVDTEAEGGKSGEIVPLYKGDPVRITLRAVNGTYDLQESVNGTALISVEDAGAQYEAIVNIVNGVGETYVIWSQIGDQTISVIGEEDLSELQGSATAPITDTFTVESGEVIYMDEVRTYLTSDVSIGDINLSVADTTGIYPGHQILLIKMTGDDAGENEMFTVASVSGNQIELETSATFSHLTSSGVTQVLLIPRIDNVIVQSGGVLTGNEWDGNTGGALYLVANTINLESEGKILATALGYQLGDGPGAGYSKLRQTNIGAGYGGKGYNYFDDENHGNVYGTPITPILLGSGGGSLGGNGGGLVKIEADYLVVDGVISSNGGEGKIDHDISAYNYGSGGSGGSIWIDSTILSGTGLIQAQGGDTHLGNGVGGAGGRIAIDTDNNQFLGSVTAYSGWGKGSGAGSIYWTDSNKLVIDNNNKAYGDYLSLSGLLSDDYIFDYIELNQRGSLIIYGEDSSIDISGGKVSGDETAKLVSEGEFIVNGPLNVSSFSLDVQGKISGTTSLLIDGSQTVEMYAETPIHSGVYTFDSISIGSGSTLMLHNIDDEDGDYEDDLPVELLAENVNVADGGIISLKGTGYGITDVIGNGPGGGSASDIYGVGGAHGGLAGESPDGGISADTYGNIENPISMGSGGGSAIGTDHQGGYGGGALHLIVTNLLDVDGTISAEGTDTEIPFYPWNPARGGGGAGGSLWIEAGEIDGSGSIIADGGRSISSSGGGGGRLAVLTDVLDLDVGLSVEGGPGYSTGEHGSIYLGVVDPALSSVVADPTEVEVGGIAASDVLTTLIVGNGHAAPYKSIDVTLIDGSTVFINGSPILLDQSISLSETDTNGELHFDVSATTSGSRELIVTVDGVELNDHVFINFTVGDFEPAYSTVDAEPQNVPADGISTAMITATANDIENLPIMDVKIGLSADGDAVLTQPTDPTDEYGQAVGYVANSTVENVTVEAEAWGIPFLNSTVVNFYGTDFVSNIDAPTRVTPGQEISLVLSVENKENYDVENVIVAFTMPELLTYNSDTSGVVPEIAGQIYTWTIPEMLAGESIVFNVNSVVSASAVEGDTMTLVLSSESAVTEINSADNTIQKTIEIVFGYSYNSSITPNDRSLYIGGEAVYTIQVVNTDILPDLYSISVSGLDAFDTELSATELAVTSGGKKAATLTVGTETCMVDPVANFTVMVTSSQSGIVQELPATVTLDSSPQIILDAPANNVISGSQSVLFSWRTDPETTGTLYIYPTDDPEAVQTYTSESGLAHSIQVDNLTRNTSYTWYVDATSACGTNTSVERVLNIGNGIVFSNHNQDITINRDYDQRLNVAVQNTDTIAHTLTSSVLNPYEDLIVNFVDSGSVDQTITLEPGETVNLTLAVHAQDAELHDYVLTANLIADADTTPIIDNANLNVEVLFEGDYTIEEDVAAYDPVSLAHTYVITNHGQAITDLSLEAIDPNTGLPASVYVTPSLDHAKLETGESIRVVVYPLFDEEDAINHIAYSPTFRVAKANLDAQSDIPFSIHLKAAGIEKMISGISACDEGRGIYTIVKDDCEMTFSSGNWYCTNRPVVTTKFYIPAFLKQSVMSSLSVSMSFSPQSDAKDHNGSILFNGETVAQFEDLLPDGTYTFDVPVEIWNEAIAGTVNQDVSIVSTHPNAGHYIVSNEFDLNIGVDNAITFVCAASQEEADLVADIMYPCGATAYFNPETDVFDNSVLALGEIKKLLKSVGESLGYDVNVSVCTQGECGDPIDSRTGVFSFASPDISFPTSVGSLGFQRTYSTGAVEQYAEVGYGWTHNHAERLIFPDNMYGMEDYMIFRDYLGNQHLFKIEGDGTYKPGPGVLAELSEISDGYMVTTADGYVLTFNNIGMATSLADAQGNAFTYTYDGEGVLQRVSADNGTRYLDFTYNDDVRIESVTDHTGRQVSFEYDEDGNLIRSTDLLDQEWTYEYDENHLMTALNDPTGLETVVTEYDMLGRAFKQFDADGNLMVKIIYHDDGSVTVEDADGNSETHKYDSRGIMIDETDQVDRGTDTNYDANFRPTTITNEIGSTLTMEWSEDGKQLLAEVDPAGNRTEYTYDENGNLTSTTDPSGNTKSYTYDGDLLTSSTDIEGKTTTYTYTAEGWLETQTDHYGRTTTYTYDEHGQRLTTTDWLGTTIGNTYDELGRQIESVDEQGRVNRNEYNAAGQLVKSIRNYDETRPQNDENIYNLTTTYTYDVFGNQQSVTDTMGNTTVYKYDSNGRLILTIDALGNENVNTYDANGQLVKSTDALGRETTYVYDAAGRRLSTVNALGISSGTTTFNLTNNSSTASDSEGNAATYYYNELNQVVRIVDPMGHETTTTYNENGNVETKTDELGRTTTYEYDDLNRLVKTTDASGAITQTVYDENGYRVASIDALGNQTTYAYDEMGRVVSTTDPLGHTTSSDYDDDGKLVSTTDAMGRTTTYTYDEWDRKASMTDGAGRTTTYTYDGLDRVISTSGPTGVTYTSYDALGRVISRTDARGHTTTTTYDDLGRVKTTTDYQGNTTTNYYDQVGNLLSSVDSQGTTSFEYDVLNRQVAVTDPLGNRTQTVYDNLGNVSDTINAKGVVTHYVYDSLQRNVAIIQNYKPGEEADADTNVRVDYTYNAVGNRVHVNDANGHITEFQYDAANRVTKKIDPIGNTWNYVYDLAGNLTSRTDGNGVTTGFIYDDSGNLLTIDYPDGEADVSFTYNNAGQRVSMTDGIGTTTWSFDNLGRVESVNDAYGNEIVYTYDEYGNRTGLQYADGKQVAYDFDSSNRLVEVASWDSLETEYDYNALGQLTSILRPNGVESTYEYDELGRLTFLEHNKDVTNLANYTYTYDEVGNIIHAEENVMGGGSSGPTVQVTVVDTTGEPLEGNTVYAYSGDEFSNYSKVTDEKGQVSITLPDGTYRFRVTVDGTEFWSGESDHCEIGACGQVTMTIPEAVLVTVIDSNNNVLAGQIVYAYEGETYSKFSGETDENGQASLRLPEGEYRFRTTLNSTPFWSATLEDEQCVVPGCTVDEILVTVPLLVTVQNDLGDPMVDLNVYVYDDATYADVFGKTDENGQVELSLPEGAYHFRADYNGTYFWSAEANHCAIPGCSEATVTVSLPVTVTVADTGGGLISGVNVYAFDESTYQNFSKPTDENGEAVFNLPGGNYRFRADYNGTQFWSGTENTCEIPGCTADTVTVTQPVTVTVLDSNGAPQDGLNVYAFNGTTYSNYSKKTNENGEAIFTLPLGDYRFRADLNGTLFWSGTENTCSLPDCGSDQVRVTIPVEVMVLNGANGVASVNVYAFNGTTYSSYSRTSDSDGVAIFTLPEGEYRFRADYNGEQIFSGESNHCTLPGCELVSIQVGTEPTQTPTAVPSSTFTFTPVFTHTFTFTPVYTEVPVETNTPMPGITNTPVAAYTDTPIPAETNTPVPIETDTAEPVESDTPLPESSSVPTQTIGMISRGHILAKIRLAPLADDTGVSVTVMDSDGTPQSGLNVYAFDGNTFSGSHAVSNESGIASFTLAEGSYRFRADLNTPGGTGVTRFWSGEENTCTTPNCVNDSITVTKPLTITVVDSDGSAQSGLNVYAFNGTTYAGYSKATNESGEAVFTLPEGAYRFRADFNGTRFWSADENHCTLPGCESTSISVTKPLTVTVRNSDGAAQAGLNVYAFDGTTYAGYSKVTNESGEAVFTLPAGDYHFRADMNGTRFWSADENHCTLPGCENVDVSVTVPLSVSVVDTDGTPQSGIAVYAFNGTTFMNFSKTTDENGLAVFTLPQGDYRFRADAGGTYYWSSEENDCTLPGCTATTVTTSKPVTVSVVDSVGAAMSGLNVYAFDGTTYAGYSKVSDEYGNAVFYLPAGDYRFRADREGTQFWSSEENACTLPGCENVIISVTLSVTVNVVDTDGISQAGLNVYAFDGETYSNYSEVTDENGQAVFSLPEGDYHFRADLNGTQFWSAEENTCTLPGCVTDSVTVTKPVSVTVKGEEGNPYADLNVYAFDGETYAGYSGKTDAGGHVTFTLPQGNYHFRADYDGVQFWSGNENTCTIPGCEEDAVTLPGGTGEQEVSIDYTYDALNRLISAEYSSGTAFGYTYDAAGNVLTYAETHYGQTTVTTYTYDAANQLLSASETDTVWYYTYDGNGSLIQTDPGDAVANGSTRYTYNTAGYLTKVENFTTEWQTQSEMTYDGLGNRLEVTTYTDGEGNTTRYVLDGGTELTAISTESTTYYLYGLGAIGTLGESWSYLLQDGAGSTRQLVDEEGAVTLSISYTPWGDTLEIYGSGNLDFSYLGGIYDAGTGLIYMGNGQYYDPYTNRFLNRGDDGQSDPYAPWSNNVASMLISPLTLLALLFGRKKNRTKFDNVIIVLVLVLTLSTSMFVVGESFVPSVSADVDRLPISWPPHAEKIDKFVTLPADIQTSAYTPVMKILLRYCNMPKSDIANYDPTIEPKGYISWGPTVYLDSDLIQFNGTQDFVDTDMNGVFDIYDQGRSYTHWGPNLCGQAAIAIIIQSTLGEVYPLTEIVEGVDTYLGKWSEGRHNQDTTSADTLAMALTIAREENNYQIDYRFYLGEEVKSYRHSDYYNWTYGKRIYPNQPEALYTTFDPASMEYAEFIRSQISQNHYHIALVTINKDNHGYLSKYTSPDTKSRISHWVVVSGFGEQWDRQGPDFEWVRIYNPYHDQTEYYPLADFLASVHPYSSLEIWQMGASPYVEVDPISNY